MQFIIRSIGYSEECLNLHFGARHFANLGDGLGPRTESLLARQYFFRSWWGTCWESIAGGHHFRAWKQIGSSAWFIGFVLFFIFFDRPDEKNWVCTYRASKEEANRSLLIEIPVLAKPPP
jgi:hypothetical protein